jgi:Brp/Blh family beta-carotene 15,15'-monooxygenase
MTQYLKIQRITFVLVAFLAILSALFSSESFNSSFMLALILIITFFGVPHGSLDVLFAKKGLALANLTAWIKFLSGYLLISALAITFWLLLPTVFFILFLLFSALHFSDDLLGYKATAIGLLYGLNIITLPSILHLEELTMLYGYLINPTDASMLLSSMQLIAATSAFLTLVMTFIYVKKEQGNPPARSLLLEVVIVGLLMLIVRPLLAFTIYFCFMHSARHILRAKFFFSDFSNTTLLTNLIAPTIIVLVFCFFVFQTLPSNTFDANLIKVTFAALAALTFPHAFLLHRIGFMKWLKNKQ